ncbi:hypothetical protein IPM65_04920 [Candidatus Roizmanbacteria bacterium]|nr:MAG: hypothetical protein IPM65_04920 [Candidatus Roizmanbacteria bacterium]
MKYRKNIIRLFFIPLGIFVLSFCLYAISIYLHDGRFFSIVRKIDETGLVTNNSERISGRIPPDIGKIGTVIFHFQQPESAKGSITFTLTEETSHKILYQNNYSIHDIYYKNDFPFGFPPIEQKMREKYVFTITPEENTNNFVLLKNETYPYEVLYQFDRTTVLKKPEQIQSFLKEKISQYSFTMFHSRNSIFYISSVFFYYLGIFLYKRYRDFISNLTSERIVKVLLQPTVVILSILLFTSSILFPSIHSVGFFFGALAWILLSLHHRMLTESTFMLALVFLLVCPLLLVSMMDQAAINLASWSFVFILIGSLQGIGNLKSKKNHIPLISTVDHILKRNYKHFMRWVT